MSQQKNVTHSLTWAERLRSVRARLRWDGLEMANHLGVTREWVSRLENEKGEFSPFVRLKVEELERQVAHQADVISHQADYAKSREKAASFAKGVQEEAGQMLRPEHQPRHEPTETTIREHIEKYLAAARAAPGGIGHAWIQVRKHLRVDDFEVDEEQTPKPEETPHA